MGRGCERRQTARSTPLLCFGVSCLGHLAPIIGHAHIAYLPRDHVVGISKLARVLHGFARRLQVQERLTAQVADCIWDNLKPLGVAVVIEASHACMTARGVRAPGVVMTTSRVMGVFRDDERSRKEVLLLINAWRRAALGYFAPTEAKALAHGSRKDTFNSILLDVLERRAPRRPLTFLGGSEPRLVRDALGCLGTGATIVTTVDAAGAPVGLTANSFTSVFLDPPLILFSLAKTSASLAALVEAERFAVNVLHIGQQPMAGLFAQRDVSRFESVDWSVQTDGGSPILVGSLVSFECRTHAVHEGGDHLIFVGEVSHAWCEPHRGPLLYFRGRFRRLHFS